MYLCTWFLWQVLIEELMIIQDLIVITKLSANGFFKSFLNASSNLLFQQFHTIKVPSLIKTVNGNLDKR